MGFVACKNDPPSDADATQRQAERQIEMAQPETYINAVEQTKRAASDLVLSIVELEELVKKLPPAKAKVAQPLLEDLRAMEAKYQGAIEEFQMTAGQSFGAYVDPNSDMAQDPSAVQPKPVPASQVRAAMEAHAAYVRDIDSRVRELSEQIQQIAKSQ